MKHDWNEFTSNDVAIKLDLEGAIGKLDKVRQWTMLQNWYADLCVQTVQKAPEQLKVPAVMAPLVVVKHFRDMICATLNEDAQEAFASFFFCGLDKEQQQLKEEVYNVVRYVARPGFKGTFLNTPYGLPDVRFQLAGQTVFIGIPYKFDGPTLAEQRSSLLNADARGLLKKVRDEGGFYTKLKKDEIMIVPQRFLLCEFVAESACDSHGVRWSTTPASVKPTTTVAFLEALFESYPSLKESKYMMWQEMLRSLD